MRTRIIFGSMMIAAVAGVLALDWRLERRLSEAAACPLCGATLGLPVAALVVALLVLGFLEFERMCRAAGGLHRFSGMFAMLVIALLPVLRNVMAASSASGPAAEMGWWISLAGMCVGLIFFEEMRLRRTDGAAWRLAATALAAAYLGLGGAAMLSIRLTYGLPALVLFLACVKFTDIGAYFTGSFAGRHKMVPWLSPGKSWEGLVGGVAVAAATALAARWVFAGDATIGLRDPWQLCVLGAALGVVGQFSDLCESLLKRSCSIKDSGSLVPSFGGVLDIIDSPLLSAPVAYVALAIMPLATGP